MMRQQTGPPQLPIYPFRCESCSAEFEVNRPVAAEMDPLSCPMCSGVARRAATMTERPAQQSAWFHSGHSHDDWSGGHAHSEGEAEWDDILQELQQRVGTWLDQVQAAGVRGADQFSALVGPAIEIYASYASVLDVQGRRVPLGGNPYATDPFDRGYLAYVWEALGRAAIERLLRVADPPARGGTADSLEPDLLLTVLFRLWTANPDGQPEAPDAVPMLPADVVRCFGEPMGIDLGAMEGRVFASAGSVVRLLPVQERAPQLLDDPREDATPLDRVHTAMLLKALGRDDELAALVQAEEARGPGFRRAAAALFAAYPRESDERMLLEAVRLVAV